MKLIAQSALILATILFGVGCGPTGTNIDAVIDSDRPTTLHAFSQEGSYSYTYATQEWFDAANQYVRPITTHIWAPDSAPQAVAIISHGKGSRGNLHTYLGEHLASHGYLVLAPDHFGTTLGGPETETQFSDRILDMRFLLAYIQQTYPGLYEARKIAAIGHSWGGLSAFSMCGALPHSNGVMRRCATGDNSLCDLNSKQSQWKTYTDDHVSTCVGLTPVVDPVYGYDGTGATSIDRAVLLFGADADEFLPLDPNLRAFYHNIPDNGSKLIALLGGGHTGFTDLANEGSLDHDLQKSITNTYTTAWLDLKILLNEHAATLFTDQAIQQSEFASNIELEK